MTSTNKITSQRWYWTSVASSLVGILLSLYLLVQHTRLKAGIQGGPSLCSLGGPFNCEAVDSSAYSSLFGIPLAAIGAVFFSFCLFVLLTAPPSRRRPGILTALLVGLALLALASDVFLLGIQAFVIGKYCLFCLLSYVANALVLVGTVQTFVPEGSFSLAKVKRALTISGEGSFSAPTAVLVGLGTLFMVGLVTLMPSFIRTETPSNQKMEDAMTQFFENWKKQPIKPIDVKEGDGTLGNSSSRVRVVVFSDFECPHCRKAAFTLNSALHPLKDRVFLVFKNFPLDPTCNPLLQYKMHAHACELANLGYCAKRKGKFWEFHDRVFLNLDEEDIKKGTEHIKAQLKDIFTPKEYDACQKDAAALKNTDLDVKLGADLGVRGTPSLYINGKQVTIPLTVENLQKLVEVESAL